MKPNTLVALATFVLGIAVGWIAHQQVATDPLGADESANPSKPNRGAAPSKTPREATSERSERTASAVAGVDDEERTGMDEKIKRMVEDSQNRQSEMMKKRLQSKFDAELLSLVQNLGLSPEQEGVAREYLEEALGKMEGNPMMGRTDPEKIREIAALLRGDGLVEVLSGDLSEEQLAGLREHQERKAKRAVETRALKEFAKLQGALDLNEEQRDQVYEVLLEDSEQWHENQSEVDFVTRELMASMGVDMNLGDMDMGNFEELGKEAAMKGAVNQRDIVQMLKDQQERKIAEKVERLAPVLNEHQLKVYEQSLQSQRGILDMMPAEHGHDSNSIEPRVE